MTFPLSRKVNNTIFYKEKKLGICLAEMSTSST